MIINRERTKLRFYRFHMISRSGYPRATIDIDMLVEYHSIIQVSRKLKDLGFYMKETILPLGNVKICRFYRIESFGLISLKLLRDNLQDKADIEYLSQLIKK